MEEKTKIYEIAKELNTTSKRLMEKLAEINIEVKSHMSVLDGEQIQALYKHIGVIQRSEGDSQDRPLPPPPPPKTEVQINPAAKRSNAPRIIRKTQINLDFEDGRFERKPAERQQFQKQTAALHQGRKRREFTNLMEDTSGLRAGFVRDIGPVVRPVRERVKDTSDKSTKIDKNAADTITKTVITSPSTEEKMHVTPEPMKVDTAAETKIKASALTEQKLAQEGFAVVPQTDIKSENAKMADSNMGKTEAEVKAETQAEEKTVIIEKPSEAGAKPPTDDVPKADAAELTEDVKPADRDVKDKKDELKSVTKEIKAKDEAAVERPSVTDRAAREERDKRPDQAGRQPDADRFERGKRPDSDRLGARTESAAKSTGKDYSDRTSQTGQNRPVGMGGSGRPPRADQSGRPRRPDSIRPGGRPQTSTGGFSSRPGTTGGRPYSGAGQDKGAPRQGGYQSKPSGINIPGYSGVEVEVTRPEKRVRTARDTVKDEVLKDKRPIVKGTQTPDKKTKYNPKNLVLGDKKKVDEVLSDEFDFEEYYRSYGSRKKLKSKREEEARQKAIKPAEVVIKVPESITVKELAEKLKKTAGEIIKKLMLMGVMVTINEEVDFDTASIIGDEFKIKVEREIVISDEDILFDDDDENDKEEDLKPRAPVVVVMGHVDHGKTSLLDAIREAHVTETEAGGITQKIGAYKVNINGRDITFLDTPGHEAFTSLRARGAQVTDVAILVVAADDGVKPQTVEAINHAKAANVQIIVAINKMDLPGANPDRVKQQLTEHGLVAEEWGGDAVFVPISAKKNENIDQLLEMVLLSADLLELKANPNRQAKGTIIEAQLDKNRGALATLLVQRGTLKLGDSIVTGTTVGRIRGMVNDRGQDIEEAGPSTPVEILGLPEVPNAGDVFYAITDERVAKHLAERRRNEARAEQFKSTSKVTLEDLFSQIQTGEVKELNIILKADMQGSVEALKQSLEKLETSEVKVKIIHSGIGAITESDVTLADVTNAIIIGFNVRPGSNVSEMAEAAKVDMKLYRIIYNAIEDVEAAMKGMLAPKFKEVVLGHAEVRQLFKITGAGTVAGCYVTDGKILRSNEVRLVRDGVVVHEGKLAALKRFKDDVKEVSQGYECGMSFEKYNDLKEGDVIEAFEMEEVKR